MRFIPQKVWEELFDDNEREWYRKVVFMAKGTGKAQQIMWGDIPLGSIWPSGMLVAAEPTINERKPEAKE